MCVMYVYNVMYKVYVRCVHVCMQVLYVYMYVMYVPPTVSKCTYTLFFLGGGRGGQKKIK